jgi:adenylate kinase family enzyme
VNEIKSKHIIFIAPPGSCKGFFRNSLQETFPKLAYVGLGELTRYRLDHEPDFHKNYDKMVEDGDLLPDEEAIPMAHTAYNKVASATEFYWDGVFRTRGQAAKGSNFFQPNNSLVILGNASREVCAHRVIERDKIKKRTDSKSFPNRFDKYILHRDDVLNVFQAAGHKIHQINVDQNLETVVMPALMLLACHFLEADLPKTPQVRRPPLLGFRRNFASTQQPQLAPA